MYQVYHTCTKVSLSGSLSDVSTDVLSQVSRVLPATEEELNEYLLNE